MSKKTRIDKAEQVTAARRVGKGYLVAHKLINDTYEAKGKIYPTLAELRAMADSLGVKDLLIVERESKRETEEAQNESQE